MCSIPITHETSARGGRAAKDRNIFTPTAVLSYRPFNRTELDFRAFYKRIFRLPTFNDLYYTQIGNRTLKPEYTTQYNIGVAYDKSFPKGFFAAISASVDTYFNKVKNKIIAVPLSNQLVWSMMNLGYVEILGVDASVQPEFRIGLGRGQVHISARLGYTFQKAQDFSAERLPRPSDSPEVKRGYGDQIPYIPRHSGSAVLGITWRNWDFNYSFIYTGERYSADNVPEYLIQPWYTHDFSLSKNFVFKKAALRATAEVNNILDQRYEVVNGYPMPGTNFKIIISLTI